MDPRLRRGALTGAAQAQAAVQVVGQQRGQTGQQHHRGGEADDELQQREAEDVEADVQAELRVGLAERRAVQPQLHRLPLPRRRRPCEQAQDDGDGDADQAAQRLQLFAVAVQRLLTRGGGGVDRPGAEGEREAGPHRHTHDHRGDDEQDRLRHDPGAEDLDEAQLTEPQHLGPELGEQHQQEHQRAEDHESRGQGPRTAAGTARSRRATRTTGTLGVGGRWTRWERGTHITHRNSATWDRSARQGG